jgi:hypothetical protein
MFDVVFGIILNLLAFTLIGIGPSLFLLSSENRLEAAAAIAPALGYAMTSIAGTYAILLDYPVSEWALGWLIIGTAISFLLCLTFFLKVRGGYANVNRQIFLFFAIGIFSTMVLVMAPMVIGGLHFTVLRGNGTDAFNYITFSRYLDLEPYSWVKSANFEDLLNRHPSYPFVKGFLNFRWATCAMLAWTARIAHVPIYRFEYGYSLLSFVLSFGLVFSLALMASVRRIYAFFLALAICVGFWAQLVLDIRAFSQISSLLAVLLLALLIARIESTAGKPAVGEYVLAGITLLAIVILYGEIIPFVVLGLTIFWGTKIYHKTFSIRRFKWYLLSLTIALTGVLSAKSFVFSYFKNQLAYAVGGKNDWHNAFFRWFYSNPVTGLWGIPSPVKFMPIVIVMTLLGVILSLLLLYALFYVIFSRKQGFSNAIYLIASFAFASFIQFFFLFSLGQWWAAGKALSFGYPYILLLPVFFGLTAIQDQTFISSAALKKIIKSGIILWLSVQILFGFYRWSIPVTAKEYPKYIVHHGEYRRHDWNVTAFTDFFKDKRGLSLWIAVLNPWVAEYLGFVFGEHVQLTSCCRLRYFDDSLSTLPSKLPQYLILDKGLYTEDMESKSIAKNSEFLLIKVDKASRESLIVLSLYNPNGIETDAQGNSFFWMGGEATKLKLFSPREGHAVLTAKFNMGPSLPERSDRKMRIYLGGKKVQEAIVTGQTEAIRIPVQEGFNEIKMEILDKPTLSKLPNGDTRPLLLGIHGLKMGLE